MMSWLIISLECLLNNPWKMTRIFFIILFEMKSYLYRGNLYIILYIIIYIILFFMDLIYILIIFLYIWYIIYLHIFVFILHYYKNIAQWELILISTTAARRCVMQ